MVNGYNINKLSETAQSGILLSSVTEQDVKNNLADIIATILSETTGVPGIKPVDTIKRYFDIKEDYLEGLDNGLIGPEGKKKLLKLAQNRYSKFGYRYKYTDVKNIPDGDFIGKTIYFREAELFTQPIIDSVREKIVDEITNQPEKKVAVYAVNRIDYPDILVMASKGISTGVIEALVPEQLVWSVKELVGGRNSLGIYAIDGKRNLVPLENIEFEVKKATGTK